MKRIAPIIVLLSVSNLYAASLEYDVDPDGGGDYTSLSAWEAAQEQDLTDGGGDTMTAFCSSSSGGDDTTVCVISGTWVTGAANWILIEGTDFPVDGVLDLTKYNLHISSGSNSYCIRNLVSYVTFRKLQVRYTGSSTGNGYALYCENTGDNCTIDSCIVKGYHTGTGRGYGVYNYRCDNLNIYNTLFYDFVSSTDTDYIGIYSYGQAGDNTYVYNCTVENCYYGYREASSGTVDTYNCIAANCTDDFDGLGTIDYCCSDTGDGTNAQTPSGGDWTNEFADLATEDYSLKSANCVGNGTDDPSSGLYSDDIIDTARSSTWDIGAFEYAGAPPAAPPAQKISILLGMI